MRIAIIGGGAFGTALSIAIGQKKPVSLWARDTTHLLKHRESPKLPGAKLTENISVTSDIGALSDHDVFLLSMPMQSLGPFLSVSGQNFQGKALVACCKGMDLSSLQGPTSVIMQNCPGARAAILTGPSFATDIAHGLPTALTIASEHEQTAFDLQDGLSTPQLRLYRTTDVAGAELGGALKNVIAIAAGVVIGAGLGDSARAALMTRGFSEMQRFSLRLGARAETLAGLSGLGDLVLTCTSMQSRNFRHGLALGAGQSPDPQATVEGVATASAIVRQAIRFGIVGQIPITRMVAALTTGKVSVREAVQELMSRPLKEE